MSEYKLSHLKELEAEAIYIIREVAAERLVCYGAFGRKGVCTGKGSFSTYAHRF